MRQDLKKRLAEVEFKLKQRLHPGSVGALYESFVQLGLGDLAIKDSFDQSIALQYRAIMVALDIEGSVVAGDFEQDMLDRYRARRDAGTLVDIEMRDDLDERMDPLAAGQGV